MLLGWLHKLPPCLPSMNQDVLNRQSFCCDLTHATQENNRRRHVVQVASQGSHETREQARSFHGIVCVSNTRSVPTKPHGSVLSFPDGVKEIHSCPDAIVDICFIHGLTGNRDSTWTAGGESTPWPATLLSAKLPAARILTYGYDAYVLRTSVASSNCLTDHAKNLLSDLSTNREEASASSRPLIFVAHSLGGIVCKEAILPSKDHPDTHLRDIFSSVLGISFMGTPHRGSWMADWARFPAAGLGIILSSNKQLLEVLRTSNTHLQSIQDRFSLILRERERTNSNIEITCFFEELALPMGKVISKESATLEGYSANSIYAYHRNMVRSGSADDNGFKRLAGELVRWALRAQGWKEASASEPSSAPRADFAEQPNRVAFNHCGSGHQYNSTGGTQNINQGSGKQVIGTFTSQSMTF